MTTADTPHRRASAVARGWRNFRRWRRGRPFWGGLLTILSAVVFFYSGHLTLGGIKIVFSPQEFLGWVIPLVLLLCGLLMLVTPAQRIFYGVLAAAVSVGGLLGLNLGGFFLGMLLGIVGGALGASWAPVRLPPAPPATPPADDEPDSDAAAYEPEGHEDATDAGTTYEGTYEGTTYAGTTCAGTSYEGAHHEGAHYEEAGHEAVPEPEAVPPPRGPLTDTLPTSMTSPLAVPPAERSDASGPDGPDGPDGGGPLPRRSPRGLAVILLALTTATVGLTIARVQSPAAAAPAPACTTSAAPAGRTATTGRATTPAPVAPGVPAPAAPGAPAAAASATASPTPTGTATGGATVTGTIGGLVTGVLDGIGSLLGLGTDPSAPPSATPSASASPSASTSPAPTGTRAGAPTPKPTARRTASPSPSPTCVKPRVLAAPPIRAAVHPAQQITAKLSQILLTFDGVTDVPTANGSIRALQFSMESSTSTPFELRVPVGVHTLDYTSSQLTVSGHVLFYTSRLDGKLLGLPVSFTPDSPPPLPQGLPIPLPITFTDVTLELVLVHADVLTAPNLVIAYAG